MKKLLLTAIMAGVYASASAIYLVPQPEITAEQVSDGKVEISWSEYVDPTKNQHKSSYYHVIVYKMHKATAPETFTLAETDFSNIESTGTIKKPQDKGAPWDCIPGMPGWYAKFPVYVDKGLGVDAFYYFAGSDNDDPFGGAYIVSPDWDLSYIGEPNLNVETEIARSNNTDEAGIAIYTFSDDFFTPGMEDYKPIMDQVWESNALSNESWTPVTHNPVPDDYRARTRMALYGSGSQFVLFNKIKVTTDLLPGDQLTYPAEMHKVEGTSFTIDTTGDTDNDFVYAYQVKGIWEDYDDYRDLNYIRSLSDFSDMKVVGTEVGGVDNIGADTAEKVNISAADGRISVTGAPAMEIYDASGRLLYSGTTTSPVIPGHGLFIVKAGTKTAKVIL